MDCLPAGDPEEAAVRGAERHPEATPVGAHAEFHYPPGKQLRNQLAHDVSITCPVTEQFSISSVFCLIGTLYGESDAPAEIRYALEGKREMWW